MSNNVYGIDLGTNNFKVYSKATGKTMLEKNTIAVIDKNQIYAYGDSAYAMYEKAPETINVIFPVVEGVIADYNLLQKCRVHHRCADRYHRCREKSILRALL